MCLVRGLYSLCLASVSAPLYLDIGLRSLNLCLLPIWVFVSLGSFLVPTIIISSTCRTKNRRRRIQKAWSAGRRIQRAMNRITGSYVSLKFTPFVCESPRGTNLALKR